MNRLNKKLINIGLEYDDEFYLRVKDFIMLLKKWGVVHNLTAELRDDKIEDNIVDSLYPMKFLDNFNSLADVGTGAGYPGMILAIANPNKKIFLIEARAKRVAFLNFVKNYLKLPNVTIIQNRVEKIDNLKVDIITSRAVTKTKLLLEITKNISEEDTEYLFYKGSLCAEEIQDIEINNYKIINLKDRNYLYIKKGVKDNV